MIRCPNCGSTAQVRMTLVKYDKIHYTCGCGCNFFIGGYQKIYSNNDFARLNIIYTATINDNKIKKKS